MRRFLIKLLAVQTAMIGWLSYWLFLVYVNNPSVGEQLINSVQRFPQLSFSTVDITVLVVIAIFSIMIAFKFHRGLKPGIRLERALQMLENLMKRNLILEAQVADLKVEKSQSVPIASTSSPSQVHSEPRIGSWEKAFRTPLEAGPPLNTVNLSTSASEEVPFDPKTGVPLSPPRVEAKPPIIIAEKPLEQPIMVTTPKPTDKPMESPGSNWEDSPKYTGESKRILTPSPVPRKLPPFAEATGLKQPHVPAPPSKKIPPSVIIGGFNPSQVRPLTRFSSTSQVSPRPVSAYQRNTMPHSDQNKSDMDNAISEAGKDNRVVSKTEDIADEKPDRNVTDEEKKKEAESGDESDKSQQFPKKKKFPYEEEDDN